MSTAIRTTILAVLALAAMAASAARAEPFRFVALGDVPYGEPAKVYPLFRTLIETINARAPTFTIHIGDIKSGGTPCTDQMLAEQRDFMNMIAGAVFYTPGDNEWTDCYRKAAGGFDPIERLAFLRKTFFDAPMTLGKTPIVVERQSDVMPGHTLYVENARFVVNDIHVISAHVVGSNNNFEVRDAKAAAEFFARDAANVAWLTDSFDRASAASAPAVIVAVQADMFEFDFNEFGKEQFLRHSGFANFGAALVEKSATFGKPVLLIYGDSHIYRITRPFRTTAPNVIGLEVFGAEDMHAVEVMADPDDPAVFAIRPLYNPALAPR